MMVRHDLHLRAPGNWVNDPNGFIFFKGKYHLFYQYFPYAPVWGTMHWGHAVSEDLVHWEHVGAALFPTVYEDQNGCFSGSALEHDGRMYLYYTGIHYKEADPKNIHACVGDDFQACQLMISSEDGMSFDNFSGKRVVVPVIEDEETGDPKDTRDPKVWQEDGNFYMILGSTYRNETGRAVIYKSRDGENWEYASQLRSSRFGRILECPDIFKVGDVHVFMGSPMYIEEDAGGYEHHAVCMTAGFDTDTCTLTFPEEDEWKEWEDCSSCRGEDSLSPGRYQYVDYGLDLYAPQTNVDKEGRRVMIAWLRMPKAVEEPVEKPWIGMMSLPRVVEVSDGHIYFRVHPEVEKYFGKRVAAEETWERNMPELPYRIRTELGEGEMLDVGGYKIWRERGFVKTDRSEVFAGIQGHRLISTTPKICECRLDIFVDKNLIEVFVNEGQYVISSVVYGLGRQARGRIKEMWTA
ncbi:glycoside hydrolase family 32 protein [Lachnospiraceae bacterium 48-42]